VFLRVLPLLAVLPAIFVASSLGDELEQRTSTYLWSRPIARWAVPAGKLCALVPIVIALTVGGWYAAVLAGTGSGPPVASSIALAAGCLAISLVATGIATSVPRYGMALTIGYALVDGVVGWLPFSLSELSITHQVRALAHLSGGPAPLAIPVLAMAMVSGLWTGVGLLRIRRIEV
jgi:ABC-type transport system involved in multi-copper enzyme maturation permease subunit